MQECRSVADDVVDVDGLPGEGTSIHNRDGSLVISGAALVVLWDWGQPPAIMYTLLADGSAAYSASS